MSKKLSEKKELSSVLEPKKKKEASATTCFTIPVPVSIRIYLLVVKFVPTAPFILLDCKEVLFGIEVF